MTTTIATMATYQPRFQKIVWDAVLSLAPQVDAVHLTVNYPYTAAEKDLMKMTAIGVKEQTGTPVILTFLKEDLGDLAKFYPLVKNYIDPDVTVLTVDDDIIYPEDYVQRINDWLVDAQNEGHSFITFGGKILKDERPYNTWKESWEKRIGIWTGSDTTESVDIPLSGVSAFKRCALMAKPFYDLRYRNNGDLLLASWARRSGTLPVSIPFAAGWFEYNPRMINKHTIWDEVKHSPELQVKTGALATEVMEIPTPITTDQ